jgi:hypothetical protein
MKKLMILTLFAAATFNFSASASSGRMYVIDSKTTTKAHILKTAKLAALVYSLSRIISNTDFAISNISNCCSRYEGFNISSTLSIIDETLQVILWSYLAKKISELEIEKLETTFN